MVNAYQTSPVCVDAEGRGRENFSFLNNRGGGRIPHRQEFGSKDSVQQSEYRAVECVMGYFADYRKTIFKFTRRIENLRPKYVLKWQYFK